MLKLSKLNDVRVKPIVDTKNLDPKKIVGYNFFKEPFCNVALIARKQSGKSTVVYNALQNCVQKGTNVMIFSPTHSIDKVYIKMKKMLKDKKANVECHNGFLDDNGFNVLEGFVNQMIKEEDGKKGKKGKDTTEIDEIPKAFADFGQYDYLKKDEFGKKIKKKVAEKKNKKICAETIIVIDDLSTSCRAGQTVAKILTKNRHFKLKIFLSVHSVISLSPMSLGMIDVFMLFPNLSQERIEEVSEKCGITFRGDTKKHKILHDLYSDATSKPFNFLYCDRTDGTYRKNFDQIYQITE
jgi:hypothetical protein